jgi:hypothetical protein
MARKSEPHTLPLLEVEVGFKLPRQDPSKSDKPASEKNLTLSFNSDTK